MKFRVVGTSRQLVCKLELSDSSLLFVRDHLFQDGSRKYSFHWQDMHGDCILRWDNAPHHQNVITFPYHRHVGREEGTEASQPMKLEMVLEHIRSLII